VCTAWRHFWSVPGLGRAAAERESGYTNPLAAMRASTRGISDRIPRSPLALYADSRQARGLDSPATARRIPAAMGGGASS
jgi:hypothetical protein